MEEVGKAIKQIGPFKVPGPNDMYAIFNKKRWNIIGKSAFSKIRAFIHHGFLLRELNDSHITLIPKKDNPTKVNYISLSVFVMSPTNSFQKFWPINLGKLCLELFLFYKVSLFPTGIFMITSSLLMRTLPTFIEIGKLRLHGNYT